LATEHFEILFGEIDELIIADGELSMREENKISFGDLLPYRVARVYDSQGDYARSDRAEVIMDRDLGRNNGFRQFSFNQDSEYYALLELSHVPSGILTVVAEKPIREPNTYEDSLDMPRNVYKFVLAWLARSLCRRLGNAEMSALAEQELSSCEKPFIATNERNKRDTRLNPSKAYNRLGGG